MRTRIVPVNDENQDLHLQVLHKWANDHNRHFEVWRYLGRLEPLPYEIQIPLPEPLPLKPIDETSTTTGIRRLTLDHVKYRIGNNGAMVELLAGIDDHGMLHYATTVAAPNYDDVFAAKWEYAPDGAMWHTVDHKHSVAMGIWWTGDVPPVWQYESQSWVCGTPNCIFWEDRIYVMPDVHPPYDCSLRSRPIS